MFSLYQWEESSKKVMLHDDNANLERFASVGTYQGGWTGGHDGYVSMVVIRAKIKEPG